MHKNMLHIQLQNHILQYFTCYNEKHLPGNGIKQQFLKIKTVPTWLILYTKSHENKRCKIRWLYFTHNVAEVNAAELWQMAVSWKRYTVRRTLQPEAGWFVSQIITVMQKMLLCIEINITLLTHLNKHVNITEPNNIPIFLTNTFSQNMHPLVLVSCKNVLIMRQSILRVDGSNMA